MAHIGRSVIINSTWLTKLSGSEKVLAAKGK